MGAEEDEYTDGDVSASFDAVSESDSSEYFADDTSDKSRKKPRHFVVSIYASHGKAQRRKAEESRGNNCMQFKS